jgi:hypothetical protein
MPHLVISYVGPRIGFEASSKPNASIPGKPEPVQKRPTLRSGVVVGSAATAEWNGGRPGSAVRPRTAFGL